MKGFFARINHDLSRTGLLLAIFLFILLYFWNAAWAWGIVWGYSFAMIAWRVRLRRAAQLADSSNGDGAQARVAGKQLLNLWLRLLLYGIALGGALYYNELNVWTTLVGIIIVNILAVYYLYTVND